MNTHRITRFVTGIGLIVVMAGAAAQAQPQEGLQIVPVPKEDLQVWIWPDRGEGATYREGDPIAFYVEATRDCFLILYNIDTRGRLRMLFPADPWDDNFVAAGESIRFPRPQDGYDWRVDGPPGIEYVQAIASEFPIALPDWPVYLRSVNGHDGLCPDPELRDFRCGDDRLEYIGIVNHKITGRYWDWCAADLATFQVRPRHVYHVGIIWDPWPDVYYGEIYIGWPVGGRIYIDGVYVGIAPLWIPRHHHGRHIVTCYVGSRLVRRHEVHFQPKREYRGGFRHSDGGDYERGDRGHAKAARRGTPPGAEIHRDRDRGLPPGVVARAPRERRHESQEPVTVRREKAERRSEAPFGRDHVIRTGDIRPEKNSEAGRVTNGPPPAAKKAFKEKRSGWLGSVTAAVKGVANELATSAGKQDREKHSSKPAAKAKGNRTKGEASSGEITKAAPQSGGDAEGKKEGSTRRKRD